MASSIKMTFTVDAATAQRIKDSASRLAIPQSQVVRDAVQEYHHNIDKISESERLRVLRVLDDMVARGPTRSDRETDEELRSIREARRHGGRRTLVDR